MNFRRLLLISSSLVAVSSDAYAGKRDLLPDESPEYNQEFSLSRLPNYSMPPQKPKVSSSSLYHESVLDPLNDRRSRIEQTGEWPYSFNGRIKVKLPSGKQARGTGVLIGPHHLLTAAHCISDYNPKGEWASDISVQLGLNETDTPFGTVKVKHVYTFKEWDDDRSIGHDMALLILNKSVGEQTGWSGLLATDNLNFQDNNISVIGYPGDKSTKCNQLWGMTGKIINIHSDRLFYNLDTNKGQSGSGISIDQSGSPYAVGIHTHGTDEPKYGNSGVRLSQDKFDQIIQWMAESCQIMPAPLINSPTTGTSSKSFKEISPLCKGTTLISIPISTTWESTFNQQKIDPDNVISGDEKGKLKKERENYEKNLTTLRTILEQTEGYEKNPKSQLSKSREAQLDKMVTKGIYVSKNGNSAVTYNLVREQIKRKRDGLKQSKAYLDHYIQDPNLNISPDVLVRINQVNTALTPFQDSKKFKKHFEGEFKNKPEYNKTLFFFHPARHYFLPGYAARKEEIENSKNADIPIRHRLAPSSNYKREEKMIEDMDELSWRAFSLEVPLRMHNELLKKDEENSKKDDVIAQQAELIRQLQAQSGINPLKKAGMIESSTQSHISLEEGSDSSSEWESSDEGEKSQDFLIN